MTNLETRPLIVGAGPVGLCAALFLACQGIKTPVIDREPQPSSLSRALAVNPRTLELLEPSGVTARMLSLGLPIRGAKFSHGDRVLVQFSFDKLPHKYPFMLALSQAATERLLADALAQIGGVIQRGVELVSCRNDHSQTIAQIRETAQGQTYDYACPWILAADGAHSTARESLKINFPGSDFPHPWQLCDLPLETTMEDNLAHVFMLEGGGFLFAIRVVEDRNNPPAGAPIWRLISNVPSPLSHLPAGAPAGEPVWESSFHIAHRIARRLQEGNVYLAGDAAHIHSPVGARGMNLGIEDAWTFSQLAATGQMYDYDSIRHRIDARVVRRVKLLSRIAKGESLPSRLARRYLLPEAFRIAPASRRMLALVTGLDHPLPAQQTQAA
jgi:2-polyprenyl-6-methoxyphenol hydroxylase-like FAD-dependent oxidoreductase